MSKNKNKMMYCTAIAATVMLFDSSQANAQQQVVLPPLATNIQSTFTPNESQAGSWDLSAVGYRSASPTSNLEAYGYASTASAGWEGFAFGAWSDDATSLDPIYDPHIEYVLQTAEVWEMLSYYTANSYGYDIQEVGLDVSICIDDGCNAQLPSTLLYDPSDAYVVMDEFSISAVSKTKSIRNATIESGSAGVALVASLREQGETDAAIDQAYPGLLEPEVQYITPSTVYNAYLNPLVYTVYDDFGGVVTGANLIAFLESKNTPEQIVYEIVNGLPLSSSSNFSPASGGGDDSWENIELEVEITGGISGETGFPVNSVSAHAEFRIKMNGSAGQIANGGQDAVQMVADVAQAAIDKVNDNIQNQSNGGSGNGGGGGVSPSQIKVVQAVAQIAGWFGGLF